MDALPADTPPAVCIEQASREQGVDARTIARELVLRNGQRGMIYSTPDGGIEVGVMRIPGNVLPLLKTKGITQNVLAWDNCLNISVGVQMLRARLDLHRPKNTSPVETTPAMATAMRMLPEAPVAAPRPGSDNASRHQCIAAAAQRYAVHPQLIQAVIKTEGGTTGRISRNTNGSYDMGLMQINSIHLPELAKLGITREQVIGDECVNIFVGTYKLRQAIDGGSDFWTGVSRYHSKTPHLGRRYLRRVAENLRQILATSAGGAR